MMDYRDLLEDELKKCTKAPKDPNKATRRQPRKVPPGNNANSLNAIFNSVGKKSPKNPQSNLENDKVMRLIKSQTLAKVEANAAVDRMSEEERKRHKTYYNDFKKIQ